MATFVFNITSNAKKNTYAKRESNVLNHDVKGVIYITENAEYKVFYNDIFYNLTEKSFSCKNIPRIYRQGISDKYGRPISYIREKDLACEQHKLIWTPFTAGSIVVGDIIKDKDNYIVFNVKDILIDYNNHECNKARTFYINNYKYINKIMNQKILNEFR